MFNSDQRATGTSGAAKVLQAFLDPPPPPEIRWQLVTIGRKTFTASYHDRKLDSLFEPFQELYDQLSVSVAWIVCKHHLPEKCLILYAESLADSMREFLANVFAPRGGVGGGGVGYEAELTFFTESFKGSRCASFEAPSVAQLGRLEELFNEQFSSFSWIFPPKGQAMLTCSNCLPSDQQLRDAFLGKQPAAGGSDWRSSSKAIKSKSKIVFHPDPPSAYGGGGEEVFGAKQGVPSSSSSTPTASSLPSSKYIEESKGEIAVVDKEEAEKRFGADDEEEWEKMWTKEDAKGGQSAKKEIASTATSKEEQDLLRVSRYEIIRDIPLGLRLVNTLRINGYGDRHLRLVGKGEEYASRRILSIKVTTSEPSWISFRPSGEELLNTAGRARRILLPTYSLQQVAQNTTMEHVFGVCFSLTLMGDDAARGEGVSLLNRGKTWLALALICSGISTGCLNLSVAQEPTMEQITAARKVRDMIRSRIAAAATTTTTTGGGGGGGGGAGDDDSTAALHNALCALFEPWIQSPDGPPSSSAMSSSTNSSKQQLRLGMKSNEEQDLDFEYPELVSSTSHGGGGGGGGSSSLRPVQNGGSGGEAVAAAAPPAFNAVSHLFSDVDSKQAQMPHRAKRIEPPAAPPVVQSSSSANEDWWVSKK